MRDQLQCTYIIWQGETPDKGVAYANAADYDRARERLDKAGIKYRCAIVPLLPVDVADGEITRIINEKEAAK